ncbi:MAG: hypothetical protein GY816_22550 [Cytophagales bacterium]|nr:hypothetical protein [Cytophagales bacterium]
MSLGLRGLYNAPSTPNVLLRQSEQYRQAPPPATTTVDYEAEAQKAREAARKIDKLLGGGTTLSGAGTEATNIGGATASKRQRRRSSAKKSRKSKGKKTSGKKKTPTKKGTKKRPARKANIREQLAALLKRNSTPKKRRK